MNENPGETPNPLNPNQPPAEPVVPADTAPTNAPEPATQPAEQLSATDPMSRPMEQAPVAEPVQPKKKKTGLVIGIVVAAVLLIGGGIAAAIVIMNMNRGDAVAAAMNKIISGETPQNVVVDGVIDIAPNDEDSPISNVRIALNSEASSSSMLNSSVAKVTASVTDGDDIEFEFDEVYAATGDLYFKIDGVADALSNYMYTMEDVTAENAVTEDVIVDDVITDEQATFDITDMLAGFSGILDVVDGQWLKISVDELAQLSDGAMSDSTLSCLNTFTNDIKNYNNSVAEMYKRNPFVTSTTGGVTLASQNYPVYKVTIDQEKFGTFVADLNGSELARNLYSCMGYDDAEVNTDDVVAEMNNLPALYVEIDNDDNFSRLYFTSDLDDSDATVTADLSFTYPTNINVAEPVEYKDFSSVIQEIFTSMYALPTGTIEEETIVEY
ncbi:hypothetical protein IJG28_02985 [Candidatus Saccharibacteria bacterium]|nr:hypothetical protein [Candidatus Saccharibacteria bacterium]